MVRSGGGHPCQPRHESLYDTMGTHVLPYPRIWGLLGGIMRIGDLVRIRQSFSQSKVGKLAIIVDKWNAWNVVINIVDTGQQFEFDIRKLEVICE